jgi:hypothetical protein
MRRFRTSAGSLCLLALLALWTSGQVSHGQSVPRKTPTLGTHEGKVELFVDGEVRALTLLQYQGRASATAIRADDGFIIQSPEELREVLSAYGYGMPGVDFQRDLVVHVHSRQRQCAELVIDSLTFKECKLLAAETTEYLCSTQGEEKMAFSLAVLPRSALAQFPFSSSRRASGSSGRN